MSNSAESARMRIAPMRTDRCRATKGHNVRLRVMYLASLSIIDASGIMSGETNLYKAASPLSGLSMRTFLDVPPIKYAGAHDNEPQHTRSPCANSLALFSHEPQYSLPASRRGRIVYIDLPCNANVNIRAENSRELIF